MQNGFGWASSLSSSLAAQKVVSWSGGGSLSDLFLKKPIDISHLAAASSWKMSHENNQEQQQLLSNQGHHHNNQVVVVNHHKCTHESKAKLGFPCEVCHPEYSGIFSKTFEDKGAMSIPTTSAPQHAHHHMPPPSLILHPQMGPSSGVLLQPPPSNPANPASVASGRRNSGTKKSSNNNSAPVKHFLCPVCQRSFSQKGNLKTHMMIHAGDKPYACQVTFLFFSCLFVSGLCYLICLPFTH